MEMSEYAAEVLLALNAEPGPLTNAWVDASRLTDEEIGTLLPAALIHTERWRATTASSAIVSAGRDRQPVYSTETCEQMLTVLAHRSAFFGSGATLAASVLVRCDGPWPATTAKLCGTIVRAYADSRYKIEAPFVVFGLSAVAGGLTDQLLRRVFRFGLDPLLKTEVDVLRRLGPTALLLVAEAGRTSGYYEPRSLPDVWQRLAAFDDYREFARQALREARHRAAEIQSGVRPFQADKAFSRDEVDTLGRCLRVLLAADEPDLAATVAPLLLDIAVAPTAAKTLPSQGLLYEVARATVEFPTPELLAALRAVLPVVRHKAVPKQLGRKIAAIERALADRPGVALRLPDLGFHADGRLEVAVGEATATIEATDAVTVSIPAAAKKAHPEAAKAAQALARRARGHYQTLVRALESGLHRQTERPLGQWREELFSTGLGAAAGRRLVWEVQDGSRADGGWTPVLPVDETLLDVFGEPVKAADDAGIRLWHPSASPPAEIAAWRDRLTAAGLRQPFKQAFREIYLLTPAEEETAVVSNRFAAHIVRHKQLYSLLKGRGWTTAMLGPWDGGGETEAWRAFGGWRILLQLTYLGEQQGAEVAGTGQVRFERTAGGAWRRAPLAEVPPIVFTEAMRDADLFTGVASIAGDPEWTARGGAYADYWESAGFGDLSETARTRRDALRRILPKLKIAGRCTLTERFLDVRGNRFSYRIHLGSANILVQPANSYLCIVAGAKTPDVFLPFDDDRLGLILSKAFLLADDDKIKDVSILRQLPG
ncbi:MAG: DUF4132 domain-containing protein [Hamadaea sp.]|nr:DUF4132 domain-containing protein [Hamadaea sp.]